MAAVVTGFCPAAAVIIYNRQQHSCLPKNRFYAIMIVIGLIMPYF